MVYEVLPYDGDGSLVQLVVLGLHVVEEFSFAQEVSQPEAIEVVV